MIAQAPRRAASAATLAGPSQAARATVASSARSARPTLGRVDAADPASARARIDGEVGGAPSRAGRAARAAARRVWRREPVRRLAVELVDAGARALPDRGRAADLGQEDGQRVLARDLVAGAREQLEPLAVVQRVAAVLDQGRDRRLADRGAAQERRVRGGCAAARSAASARRARGGRAARSARRSPPARARSARARRAAPRPRPSAGRGGARARRARRRRRGRSGRRLRARPSGIRFYTPGRIARHSALCVACAYARVGALCAT